jgi:hypothetical protein
MPVNVLPVGIAHRDLLLSDRMGRLARGRQFQRQESGDKVLERFLAAVDPASIQAVVADREFIATGWLRHLRVREIPPSPLACADRRIGIASAVSMVILQVGYAATFIVGFTSLASPAHPIADPMFATLEVLILARMPTMVVLMVAGHGVGVLSRRRRWVPSLSSS